MKSKLLLLLAVACMASAPRADAQIGFTHLKQAPPKTVPATGTLESMVVLPQPSTPILSGTPLTFQVMVEAYTQPDRAESDSIPTGSVRLYYGNALLASANLNASGDANFSLSTTGVPAGAYQVSAAYSGDSTYLPSTSSGSVTIVAQQTTLMNLEIGPTYYDDTYVIGDMVPLDAAIYAFPSTRPITGTVTFTSGASTIGTVRVSAGTAILNLNSAQLSPGTYPVHAAYSGDANNLPSSTDSSFTLVASTPTQMSTYVSGGYDPVFVQGTVATVTVYVGPTTGNGTPTGTVTVLGNGVPVGTARLAPYSSGGSMAVLNLSTSGFAPGIYTVSANYNGDARNMPSTDTDTEQQVTVVDETVLTVSASPNPVNQGATAFLAVRVSSPTWPQAPTGAVYFSYAGTPLGSISLDNSGRATFPLDTSGLSPGSYLITATYGGSDASMQSSGTVTLTVE